MCNSTVPTIPPLRSMPLPPYTPTHRRAFMYIPPAAQRGHVDLPSEARCTGGLVNDYGTRLTNCRATFCPRCQPADYASHMARHATDSL